MKMWMAVKRLNRRFDCWSAHAADKMVANLDNTGGRQKSGTVRHISVWDLLTKDRGSGEGKTPSAK